MKAKYVQSTAAVILIASLALTTGCPDSFAQPRGGGHGGGASDRRPGYERRRDGARHYYHNGSWYRHCWLGFDIAVGALAVGALIDSLPPRCTTVVVAGTPYYYYGNYYYQPSPYGGYVVVPPPVLAPPVAVAPQPVVIAAPAAVAANVTPPCQDVTTINIPNSRGGYTAVTLRKSGMGYIGSQGEYYSDNPTVEQLKVLYGK